MDIISTDVPSGLVGDHVFPIDFSRGPQASLSVKFSAARFDIWCSTIAVSTVFCDASPLSDDIVFAIKTRQSVDRGPRRCNRIGKVSGNSNAAIQDFRFFSKRRHLGLLAS